MVIETTTIMESNGSFWLLVQICYVHHGVGPVPQLTFILLAQQPDWVHSVDHTPFTDKPNIFWEGSTKHMDTQPVVLSLSWGRAIRCTTKPDSGWFATRTGPRGRKNGSPRPTPCWPTPCWLMVHQKSSDLRTKHRAALRICIYIYIQYTYTYNIIYIYIIISIYIYNIYIYIYI